MATIHKTTFTTAGTIYTTFEGDANIPAQVSSAEKTAGTETATRSFSPQDVHDMIDTHAAGGGGGLNNIVEDTTPQLGGNLDLNSNNITGTGSISHTGNLATTGNITVTGTVDGRDVATDGTKLDGIETGATADQSDSEIETAYNNQVSKISSGEISAGTETAVRRFSPQDVHDMIDAHAPGGGGGMNDLVDDTTPQLGGQLDVNGNAIGNGTEEFIKFTETGSAVNEITVTNAATGNGPTVSATGDDTNIPLNLSSKGSGAVNITGAVTVSSTVDGRDLATDGTKLDGIETGATADQSDAEIKTAYENNADTNAFTDADHTKLDGIETGATADQSDSEIETAYNNQVAQVSAGEITAGTETGIRRYSPADVKSFVDTHGSGSSLGYTLQGQGTQLNLSDSNSFYFGSVLQSAGTTEDLNLIHIPADGTITKAYFFAHINGTLGSSENVSIYVRYNNTDTAITTTADFSTATVDESNTSLSISVTAGNTFEFKVTTPAMATNPTQVRMSGFVYIT